jgi:hypothetical protein
MKAPIGLEIKFHIYLSLEINAGVWSASHHNNFTQGGKVPGEQWIEDWVGHNL